MPLMEQMGNTFSIDGHLLGEDNFIFAGIASDINIRMRNQQGVLADTSAQPGSATSKLSVRNEMKASSVSLSDKGIKFVLQQNQTPRNFQSQEADQLFQLEISQIMALRSSNGDKYGHYKTENKAWYELGSILNEIKKDDSVHNEIQFSFADQPNLTPKIKYRQSIKLFGGILSLLSQQLNLLKSATKREIQKMARLNQENSATWSRTLLQFSAAFSSKQAQIQQIIEENRTLKSELQKNQRQYQQLKQDNQKLLLKLKSKQEQMKRVTSSYLSEKMLPEALTKMASTQLPEALPTMASTHISQKNFNNCSSPQLIKHQSKVRSLRESYNQFKTLMSSGKLKLEDDMRISQPPKYNKLSELKQMKSKIFSPDRIQNKTSSTLYHQFKKEDVTENNSSSINKSADLGQKLSLMGNRFKKIKSEINEEIMLYKNTCARVMP